MVFVIAVCGCAALVAVGWLLYGRLRRHRNVTGLDDDSWEAFERDFRAFVHESSATDRGRRRAGAQTTGSAGPGPPARSTLPPSLRPRRP